MREGSPLGVRTLLGISVVVILGAGAVGCETGRVLGDTCTRDSDCVTGVCVGAICRAPLTLGTQLDAGTAPPDAEPDAEPDAAPDAEPDVEQPDAEPDAEPDVEQPDAEPDADQSDASDAAAPDGDTDV